MEEKLLTLIDAAQDQRLKCTAAPGLFREEFGTDLDYRGLGYTKLKGLVADMSHVSMNCELGSGFEYLCRVSESDAQRSSMPRSVSPHPCRTPHRTTLEEAQAQAVLAASALEATQVARLQEQATPLTMSEWEDKLVRMLRNTPALHLDTGVSVLCPLPVAEQGPGNLKSAIKARPQLFRIDKDYVSLMREAFKPPAQGCGFTFEKLAWDSSVSETSMSSQKLLGDPVSEHCNVARELNRSIYVKGLPGVMHMRQVG